jgi:hypothetical protein
MGRSLNGIERNAAVRRVSLKTQNQLHVIQTATETGVDGVQKIRKVKGRFGRLNPSSGRTEKLVPGEMSHKEFAGQWIILLHE